MSGPMSRWPAGAIMMLMALAPLQAAGSESRMTREYVNAAAQSDAFERMEATTALAQSETPAVRAFATRMLSDHAASSERLAAATSQAGLMTPQPGISGDQSAFLAALQSARGKAFDRLYARHQALAHRAALATQEDYAALGDVPALKQLAAATADMVRHHIDDADRLTESVGSD